MSFAAVAAVTAVTVGLYVLCGVFAKFAFDAYTTGNSDFHESMRICCDVARTFSLYSFQT